MLTYPLPVALLFFGVSDTSTGTMMRPDVHVLVCERSREELRIHCICVLHVYLYQ